MTKFYEFFKRVFLSILNDQFWVFFLIHDFCVAWIASRMILSYSVPDYLAEKYIKEFWDKIQVFLKNTQVCETDWTKKIASKIVYLFLSSLNNDSCTFFLSSCHCFELTSTEEYKQKTCHNVLMTRLFLTVSNHIDDILSVSSKVLLETPVYLLRTRLD